MSSEPYELFDDRVISLVSRVFGELQKRPKSDISQKSFLVLHVIYPNVIHYTKVAQIIRMAIPDKECADSSVDAAFTTWVAWGLVERVGEGIYRKAPIQ